MLSRGPAAPFRTLSGQKGGPPLPLADDDLHHSLLRQTSIPREDK